MKERPILFSTPMVQAILEGRKTVTRRVVSDKYIINDKPNQYKFHGIDENGCALFEDLQPEVTPWISPIPCLYGKVGDILWVRETWEYYQGGFNYKAGKFGLLGEKWKPSIHMPKAACRIKLEITSITVERLHDITEEDAIKEGVEPIGFDKKTQRVTRYRGYPNDEGYFLSPRNSFKQLWSSINGPDSWDANPWVWRIEFKRIENKHE